MPYITELKIWIKKLGHSKINKNYLKVYCFDRGSANFCDNSNIPHVLLNKQPLDRRQVWIERCKVFLELTREGLDFVHSDLDALWDKDIRKYLSKKKRKKDFDIAFSCGTYNPPSTWKLYGFVLCAGLFYSQSSNKTMRFWERVLDLALACNDDQEAINTIFKESCSHHDIQKKNTTESFVVPGPGGGEIPACSFPANFSTATCLIEDSKIVIGIIPHKVCSRVTYQQRGKFVNHPLLAPSDSRLNQYIQLGLIPSELNI